jgi:hypothetical protein
MILVVMAKPFTLGELNQDTSLVNAFPLSGGLFTAPPVLTARG